MVTNDASLVQLKHLVIQRVAELAWQDSLNEDTKDALPYEIIPGPRASYRCCIYKEREIVRQRIRLACGQVPKGNTASEDNIVQVIGAACEECPIASYVVTDNCRNCMGKACLNSCKFGAISIGQYRAGIDPDKCKECGKCATACPYSAIAHLERPCKKACPVDAITYDEYGVCQINDKCVQCGACIHSCPFGAIGSKTYILDIIAALKSGKKVIAMCAPATEGQYGEKITMASIKTAVKKFGFYDMVEVGLGGDMTAAYEALEWAEAYKEGHKMTTSCCPAFINMLRKHYPEQFEKNMSSTVSPMCAVSRYVKYMNPDAVTVFVGPCIAKKNEAQDETVKGNADFVLTYGELHALLRSKGVEFEPEENTYQEASIWGKRFANVGGVAAAVVECMEERGEDTTQMKLLRCSGGAEIKKALTLLKAGRLEEDFIEGMACPGGCVGGPSKHRTEPEVRRARDLLIGSADKRKVLENLANYPMDKFSMHRDGHMD